MRGTEGRLRGRLKHVCICLVVNTYEVRGRTEELRGPAAAQLRGNVAFSDRRNAVIQATCYNIAKSRVSIARTEVLTLIRSVDVFSKSL